MIGALIAITFVAQSANANDIMAGLLTEFEKNNEAKKLASLIKVTEGSSDVLYLYSEENITLTNLTDTLIAYNDTADYSSASKIIADMNAGTDTSTIEKGEVTLSDNSKDTLVSIENITGSSYDDTIKGDVDDNISNIFDGGAGNDTIYGGAGNDTIYGRDGNDLIRGDDGDDSLDGGTGNDTFIATDSNDGQDVIDGGNDSDTVDYSAIVDSDSDGTTGGITVNLEDQFTSSSATVTVNGGNNDTLKNIENIIGTQNNDTITASQEINTLKGASGNDLFKQTATGVNADDIDGGNDIDTVDYTALSSGVTVTLNTSTYSTVTSGSTTHKIVNIENVTGTSKVDFIVGDSNKNTLIGNDGNDSLYGGDNDDKLYGGNDNDRLRGGEGDDLLNGGEGIDTADYSDATEDLDVNIADGSKFISTSQGTDTFNSIEGVIGGSGNDKLTGNTKANTLIGNNGNDILDGAGTSTAGAGEYDYLDGGDGEDSVSYKDFTDAVTINLGLTYSNSSNIHNFDASSVKDYQNAGAAGNIRILNVENLEGGSGNDIIYGNASNNTLIGRDGLDTFRGDDGKDVIYGGVVDITTDPITNVTTLTHTDTYIDTMDYSYLTADIGIIVNMNTSGEDDSVLNKGLVTQDGHYSSDILYGIERIIGSQYADLIIGDTDDNVNNTFEGKAGDDTLSGGSGNDSLLGGSDNDTLSEIERL
jgi:Ca2+-binding RTX toxin-like protein